jgi:hypothetical protein
MSETLLILFAALLVPLIIWAINHKLAVKNLPTLVVTLIVVAALTFVVVWLSPARGVFAFLIDFGLIYAGSNLAYQLVHYIARARGGRDAPPVA